ncbi:MAG: two-component system response regulator [Roseiflexus castenholzii]|uniref:response regulator n=1 Tax=Roseiflexus castenholzii TaxID=120962 RepID=UPI000CA6BF19|nr:MAG: two-component system response regulator [Roseiflexus castenholzii]
MTRILIVEDDAAIRELLARRLNMAGYNTIFAEDGIRALLASVNEAPDLILMDMGLPILNGWQVTERIKKRPETRNIPIIALTAYALSDDRYRALNIGCDDFEAKPIDFDRLIRKIEKLLSTGARQRETAA